MKNNNEDEKIGVKNKIITHENENNIRNEDIIINIKKNKKGFNDEEKINTNKNIKTNEITSNNSDNTNVKTNIEKPKQIQKNGLDIQIWSKNFYYIGYYKNGLADGIGKLITGNSKYLGEFKNDQANGFGIFHNNSKETIYEGYWLNDTQNEYGIEKWSDDSIFFGEYSDGKKNGIGIYIWKDGRYEGEFINNKFEGYGIYFYNKNKIYMGHWEDNKKNGYGIFIFGDRLYSGNYLNNEKNGFGISYWKTEDKIYVGFWKNNKKNGFGKFFYSNKIKYGLWGDDCESKKTEYFNNKEDAFNYLENNNLGKYKQYFKYNKEEIIFNINNLFNEDFISPTIISEILIN